jgi:repressor of nif and glnA expression
MYEIADELNKKGFNVSSRLVSKVLADYGLSKKNG